MRNDAHQYFLGTSNEEFEQEYWEGGLLPESIEVELNLPLKIQFRTEANNGLRKFKQAITVQAAAGTRSKISRGATVKVKPSAGKDILSSPLPAAFGKL